MKKTFCITIFLLCLISIHAEKWTTIKEKYTTWQGISIAESDTELCTLAASSTYSDGVVIFYVHAGKRDKQTLLEVYNKVENQLKSDENANAVEFTTNYISDLRNNGTITAINFETDPIEYKNGIAYVKTHLYWASYIDKAASDLLEKLKR